MALKTVTNSERGSAALEAIPVAAILSVFAAGFLLAAYVLFARSWIQYQGEQALYCVSERRPAATCKRELTNKINGFLPWGKIGNIDLRFRGDKGKLDIKWVIQGFTIRISKQISIRQILRRKGLP